MAETLSELTCGYCKKTFRRAESLVVHLCEPKRRRSERSERGVELGFQSYLRFYEIAQGSAKLKTFDDFADSPYYRAFVKFGRYGGVAAAGDTKAADGKAKPGEAAKSPDAAKKPAAAAPADKKK